jgi:hypothetical protein
LPFSCPFAATKGFAQVRRRDLQPIGIIRSGRNYPALDLGIVSTSGAPDNKGDQSLNSADSGNVEHFPQPRRDQNSPPDSPSDGEDEKGGGE